ncbi:MAG: hypothetical protein QM534_08175 [Sediminibacterium sp.]|nr:hypothetical protein [Sediminibacterium sp.]
MNIEKFKRNLGLTELPVELEKLAEFQNKTSSFENYSQGFGLYIQNKSVLKRWSNNDEFLNHLYPFAQADGCGSMYVIWDNGSGSSLSEMPIVVFGDEGDVHIVAENLKSLLHLVSYDVEISALDKIDFWDKDEDYEPSKDLNKYLKWLEMEFGLTQVKKPDAIVKAAQKNYKKAFSSWMKSLKHGKN